MIDRRTLLAMAVAPILPALNRTGFKVGDWVQVVAVPRYTVAEYPSSWHQQLRRADWKCRQALGNRYQVIYVYEGKTAIDLGPEVAEATGTVIVPMELESELIVRVPVPEGERLTASEKLRATLRRYEELDALPAGITLRSLLEYV